MRKNLTLNKLQQKVSQRFIVVLGVLNNISKDQQNLTMQKVFFSTWRARWPPNSKNSNYLLIYHPKLLILMHCHLFLV